MSINFHAQQNRGFLFSVIEEIQRKWRERFTDFDPERVLSILGLERDERYLYVTYYDDLFRLRLSDGVLEKKLKEKRDRAGYIDLDSGQKVDYDPYWTEDVYFNEAMSVYHILYHVKDEPRFSGEWLTNENIINSNARTDIPDPLLTPFSAKFSGRTDELKRACEAAGGKTVSERGDVCFEFVSFPQIPLRLVFWDADEDFPAQTKILFDSCVTDYVHIETTGCIIADLFDRLEALCGDTPDRSV
ncbi:MAG: DUF3786 domain-containing protein [Eubacteriaceae bacterium]|nr:DUF3786 domain-containing protein [Eubacteriaceae bacterium]